MTKCAHIEEKLSAYLEGFVTAEEKGLIEEHLTTCERCSAALSDLKKTQEVLRNLEEVEPPPWFTQKVMARVREESVSRKGILERLFYPFHIKIPIEAMATCLVVVLAFYMYKTTGHEMKTLNEPQERPTVISKEIPQKRYEKAPSTAWVATEKPGVTLRADREMETEKRSTVLPESPAGTGMALKDEKPMQKTADAAIGMLRKEGSIAPSAGSAANDIQKQKTLRLAREARGPSYAIQPQQIGVTVHASDVQAAAAEAESQLRLFGAHNITKESREGSEIFVAEMPGQKVKGFFDALKTMGDVKGKDIPSKPSEEYLVIRIEITGNP